MHDECAVDCTTLVRNVPNLNHKSEHKSLETLAFCATTTTKTKGAMVRAKPKTICTVDVEASAKLP